MKNQSALFTALPSRISLVMTLLTLLLTGPLGTPAMADPPVDPPVASNLTSTDLNAGAGVYDLAWLAQAFTVVGDNWYITSMTLNLNSRSGTPTPVVEVRESAMGVPSSTVVQTFTLNALDIPTTNPGGEVLLYPGAPFTLDAGTYWVVLGNTSGSNLFGWTTSSTIVQSGLGGTVDPNNYAFSADQGASFTPGSKSFAFVMSLNGVPEPSTTGLLLAVGLVGAGTWAHRRRKA